MEMHGSHQTNPNYEKLRPLETFLHAVRHIFLPNIKRASHLCLTREPLDLEIVVKFKEPVFLE